MALRHRRRQRWLSDSVPERELPTVAQYADVIRTQLPNATEESVQKTAEVMAQFQRDWNAGCGHRGKPGEKPPKVRCIGFDCPKVPHEHLCLRHERVHRADSWRVCQPHLYHFSHECEAT